MKTRELLRAHVVTIEATATLQDAIDRFDLYQVSELPVVDDQGALVGLLVEADVIPELLHTFASGGVVNAGTEPISSFSRRAIWAAEDDDAVNSLKLLLAEGLSRMPIVAGGRVVGTIGRVDLAQAVLDGSLCPDLPSEL